MRLATSALITLAALAGGCGTPVKTAADLSRDTLNRASVRVGDQAVPLAQLRAAIRSADLVCLGEQHDDADHHRVQHAVMLLMLEQSKLDARQLGVGMEMFQQPAQPLLDQFVRGAIDEAELLELGAWRKNWGYGYAMYAPLLRTAHDHRVPLLALNAPRELTRRVARDGLLGLPARVREALPDMKLDDEQHRAFFRAAMGGGPHGSQPVSERYYAAQVLWDETMASAAAHWLGDKRKRRRLLVVAGNGHCHESAIVGRVERRLPGMEALSVLQRPAGDAPLAGVRSDFAISLPAAKEPATTVRQPSETPSAKAPHQPSPARAHRPRPAARE